MKHLGSIYDFIKCPGQKKGKSGKNLANEQPGGTEESRRATQ